MQITNEQFEIIEPILPKYRGKNTLSGIQVINAILYIMEHDCTWRSLPEEYGRWHSVYTKVSRWSEKGILEKVFQAMVDNRIIQLDVIFHDKGNMDINEKVLWNRMFGNLLANSHEASISI